MDRTKALKQLKKLTEAKRSADVALLERLQMEVRALDRQVSSLEHAALDNSSPEEEPSAFQLSGRNALWDAWRSNRTRELNVQIARIRADIEQQKVHARLSTGKNLIVGKLVKSSQKS